jgi:hypothetical protein
MKKERRRTPRLKVEHPVHIKNMEEGTRNELFLAHSIDINLNGLFCRSTHSLPLYSKVMLSLSLPIIGGNGEIRHHDIQVEGMVVRVELEEKKDMEKSYSIAFSFIEPSDRVDLIIGKYILQNILFNI